jgi:hypothetical protein
MGGIVCQIERNAILQFTAIPTDPKQLPKFDAQLRACFASGEIATAIETAGTGAEVCELLWKQTWSTTDRADLYGYLEALWTP